MVESDGSERALTPAELAAITFYPDENGRIVASTSDFSLDGEVWPLKIINRSTGSTSIAPEAFYRVDLTFTDGCKTTLLEEAKFELSTYSFTLWESQSMLYMEMVDLVYGAGFCGGYTSLIEYVAGPKLDLSFP